MPYASITDLPQGVQNALPEHGQHIYMEAFNNAQEQYSDPSKRRAGKTLEETAHAVAWNAVEHEYTKNAQGEWVKARHE